MNKTETMRRLAAQEDGNWEAFQGANDWRWG
jgi:hypothetical protein